MVLIFYIIAFELVAVNSPDYDKNTLIIRSQNVNKQS